MRSRAYSQARPAKGTRTSTLAVDTSRERERRSALTVLNRRLQARPGQAWSWMERETGFEPAAHCLGSPLPAASQFGCFKAAEQAALLLSRHRRAGPHGVPEPILLETHSHRDPTLPPHLGNTLAACPPRLHHSIWQPFQAGGDHYGQHQHSKSETPSDRIRGITPRDRAAQHEHPSREQRSHDGRPRPPGSVFSSRQDEVGAYAQRRHQPGAFERAAGH
jgi:hypothetical protein